MWTPVLFILLLPLTAKATFGFPDDFLDNGVGVGGGGGGGGVLPGGGKIWAVLVAGSDGFFNYRHQADVCHAYHVSEYSV